MSEVSKLQKLEKETNKSIKALADAAQETKRLSIAASKNAERLEQEAAKICENTKTISERASNLADFALAASKK